MLSPSLVTKPSSSEKKDVKEAENNIQNSDQKNHNGLMQENGSE